MKIIGTTNDGFLLEATTNEIRDLQRSLGQSNPNPKIGETIPATDVARDIRELRELSLSSDMRNMVSYYESVGKKIEVFKKAAERFDTKGGKA